jgi:DHA1 family bicyclomycin/chloramphenicol resistance-like MFS transporter
MLLILAVALGPMSTDFYLPSLPSLVDYFATDVARVQLTLSVFLVGFAVGQLFYGPLSDRYGRRPVMMAGVAIFTLASVACMLATSIEMLVAARLVQAIGASAGPVLGRAVVRDVYGREGAARMLSLIGAAMALAPLVGPVVAGYLIVAFGWQSSFLVLTFYGVLVLFGIFTALGETNPHLGETTSVGRMLRNYRAFLHSREWLGYVLCNSAAYAGLFAFISGSSHVFIKVLGLAPHLFGFCFSVMVAGYIGGTMLSARMVLKLGIERMVTTGVLLCAFAGLAMAGLALAGMETVWSVLVPMALFSAGVGLVMPNSMAGAIGPFPTMAGAASALLGFIQMTVSALVGIGVGAAFDGTARPMAVTIALSGAAALAAYWLMIRGNSDTRSED